MRLACGSGVFSALRAARAARRLEARRKESGTVRAWLRALGFWRAACGARGAAAGGAAQGVGHGACLAWGFGVFAALRAACPARRLEARRKEMGLVGMASLCA